MGQLFYYKMLQFITKYIRIFTTKCNSFITKYAVITKCDDFITKYDVYYKLRQYNISSPPCGRGLLRNFVPLTITADKGPPYLVKTVKKRGISGNMTRQGFFCYLSLANTKTSSFVVGSVFSSVNSCESLFSE